MSLGLVSYGDSDDSDEETQPTKKSSQPASRIPTSSSAPVKPDFKRPPPPLFPGAVAPRKSATSTYSQLVERDEKGRIRITAPRLDDHDSDEEEDSRQFKKPKIMAKPNVVAPGAGLMAVLPDPEGPKKRGDVAKDSDSVVSGWLIDWFDWLICVVIFCTFLTFKFPII